MTASHPSFSPSEYHAHLMAQTSRTLQFQGGDVKQWQKRLRSELRRLLGDFPKERPPLDVRPLWEREVPLGRIEKFLFKSEPFSDVVAYFCIPKGLEKPYPTMICLQGHSTGMHNSIGVSQEDESKPVEVAGDRDFALGCMRRGVAALCLEQRSFGERGERAQQSTSPNGCHDAVMQALMLGKTLLGERVFDVDRAIDYLAYRGGIDLKRIGVMGNSGGGTTALFSAALLPRISFAMVSSYFCTFKDSIMAMRHCGDNYIPGLLKYAEMSDIAGLIAPKPLLIVHGREDEIFPITGTQSAFEETKKIYQACNAEDRVQLVVGPEGHRFYAELAWSHFLKNLKI